MGNIPLRKGGVTMKVKARIKAIVTILIVTFFAWIIGSYLEVNHYHKASECSPTNFFVLYTEILNSLRR